VAFLLLVTLVVCPWLLTARRRLVSRPPGTPAWAIPAPRQPVEQWVDPDEWWREASAMPSRLPRAVVLRAPSALEA
jgi:hypothetical protein